MPSLPQEVLVKLPKYCPKPTQYNLATQYYHWNRELNKKNRELQKEKQQLQVRESSAAGRTAGPSRKRKRRVEVGKGQAPKNTLQAQKTEAVLCY